MKRNFKACYEFFDKAFQIRKNNIAPDEEMRMNNLITTKIEVLMAERTPESIKEAEKEVEKLDKTIEKYLKDENPNFLKYNQYSICNHMFKARFAAMRQEKEECIWLHLETIELVKEGTADQNSPMLFPFYQTCISDFKDIGEDKLSSQFNHQLVESVTRVFGTDNIFYLGYSFDYLAQMMQENFNLGF